jgi:quercetin dioxygenase-like cupin family protein
MERRVHPAKENPMAIPHALPGELISVAPYGADLAAEVTHAIFKSEQLEVIRVVLPAGKEYTGHISPGELTIQCIEGQVRFDAQSHALLTPATMVYVPPNTPYKLAAADNASLLITIRLAETEGSPERG